MIALQKPQPISAVILLLLAISQPGQLQAQTATPQEVQVQNNLGSLSNSATTIRPFNLGAVGTKGSPLLLPYGVPGEATMQSGRQLTTGRFNYDVYERQLTLKTSSRDSVRYMGTDVEKLILRPRNNQSPIYLAHFPDVITDEAALKTELVRVILRGTYTLVQLPIRRFLKTSTSQTYAGQGKVGDEYYDDSTYYLIRPDHTAERVKLSKKSLVRALKEKGASFESFVKANSVNFDDEADVARAIASLN